MRGSLSDFFATAPTTRPTFPAWPPDFRPQDVDFFAKKPDASEVIECRECTERHRCQPGQFAKPECCEQDTAAPQAQPTVRMTTTKALVLAELGQGNYTMQELADALGLSYHQLRRTVERLVANGEIVCTGREQRGVNGQHSKVYGLPGSENTRDTRADYADARSERGRQTDERIIALLRERGPLAVRQVAEALAASENWIRTRMYRLVAAGRVRSAGEGRAAWRYGTTTVELWEAV